MRWRQQVWLIINHSRLTSAKLGLKFDFRLVAQLIRACELGHIASVLCKLSQQVASEERMP
jgi:hypothetical protein